MSDSAFMEKLLDAVDVVWKPLGHVGEVRMCKRILKEQTLSEGEIPFYKIGTFGKYPDAYISRNLFEDFKSKYSYPKIGAVLLSASGTIGRAVIFDGKDAYFQDSNIVWIDHDESKVLNKYLFHFYKVANWNAAEGGTIQRLYNDNLRKVLVPIPCPEDPEKSLEIQAEIVRILDAFTELTTQLTAELTQRKKQYNYYRNKLLSFEDGEVEWKSLAEVAEYSKTRISFELLDKTNYVGVDNLLQNRAGKTVSNYVPATGNMTEYRKDDILIGNIRPYLKKIWHADGLGGTNGDVLVIHRTNDKVNARYLYQILADERFFDYNMQHAKGAKMPRGDKDKLMEYRFQIPKNPNEQARIAFILDKFDTLTNSITEGLPREIALRQKQYEYYRDLLLRFPKPEDVAA